MPSLRRDPRSTYHYRYFGGFRLVLAALVMLQHFASNLAPEPLALAFEPYPIGAIAVLAFYALSAFVITEAVDCVYRERSGPFLVNRLLRIVPHFLLAVALSMLAHEIFRATGGVRLERSQPLFPDDAFALLNVLLNFVSIVPMTDRFIDYNFLGIAWALRVEMAFYLVMYVCIAIGRRLPGARGFALTASSVLVLLVPLFYLAVRGRGIQMLEFVPYFAFGGGLYFATAGVRAGWLTVSLSVPAMIWQCIAHPAAGAFRAIPPSVAGNLILLMMLLSIMIALAFSKINRWRDIDRVIGNLTYPLYLYHEDVMVMVLTFTTGYSYGVFAGSMLLSLLVAVILMALVDPVVTYYRDRVRGRSLQQVDGQPRLLRRITTSRQTLPLG